MHGPLRWLQNNTWYEGRSDQKVPGQPLDTGVVIEGSAATLLASKVPW
jgi:hypothetical protein